MPTAILAGTPPDIERRMKAAVKNQEISGWSIAWQPSKNRNPGLAPSQLGEVLVAAARADGAHVLVFRGRDAADETATIRSLVPYFRLRWLERALLEHFPHSPEKFVSALKSILDEELEWMQQVKPEDEASCLLLPECAFAAADSVKSLWSLATQASIDRIRSAARAKSSFRQAHWNLDHPRGAVPASRFWIDIEHRIFSHRGPRHGTAAFPTNWKYSFSLPDGFHFDVTSREGRRFHVDDAQRTRHQRANEAHCNIDPHGHVR